MASVEVFTKSWCPYCGFVKAFLDDKGIAYREIDVTYDPVLEREMHVRSGQTSVPQVFIDDRHIGGSDALVAAASAGLLDALIGTGEDGGTS